MWLRDQNPIIERIGSIIEQISLNKLINFKSEECMKTVILFQNRNFPQS